MQVLLLDYLPRDLVDLTKAYLTPSLFDLLVSRQKCTLPLKDDTYLLAIYLPRGVVKNGALNEHVLRKKGEVNCRLFHRLQIWGIKFVVNLWDLSITNPDGFNRDEIYRHSQNMIRQCIETNFPI